MVRALLTGIKNAVHPGPVRLLRLRSKDELRDAIVRACQDPDPREAELFRQYRAAARGVLPRHPFGRDAGPAGGRLDPGHGPDQAPAADRREVLPAGGGQAGGGHQRAGQRRWPCAGPRPTASPCASCSPARPRWPRTSPRPSGSSPAPSGTGCWCSSPRTCASTTASASSSWAPPEEMALHRGGDPQPPLRGGGAAGGAPRPLQRHQPAGGPRAARRRADRRPGAGPGLVPPGRPGPDPRRNWPRASPTTCCPGSAASAPR